jgi:hypothetical protein
VTAVAVFLPGSLQSSFIPAFLVLIGIAAQRRDLGKDCGTALDNDKYSKENAT